MRFKVDENLPAELADDLREAGHVADTVSAEGLAGFADAAIVEAAREEARVLVTLDKGLGDIRRYPPETHAGVVVLRPRVSGRTAVLAFARLRLGAILKRDLVRRLTVVTARGLRQR